MSARERLGSFKITRGFHRVEAWFSTGRSEVYSVKSLKLNKNFTLVSYLLNSSKVNLNSLSTKSYINYSNFKYNNNVNTSISNDFKLKDFYLILNTDNILSYDNLRLLN